MKTGKILAYISLVALSLIVLLYLAIAGYLLWNERSSKNTRAVHESLYHRSTKDHHLQLIDNGPASLRKRVELVRQAKRSIDLEFFIYNIDAASKLLTREVIAKAREGVKVRLLVDFAMPVFQLRPQFARVLEQAGVDVRYYNTTSLFRLISVQHRSHRKLLIVDDKHLLTGGRNVADEYFGLSRKYNFLDSDLYIRGELAKAARKSFDVYWKSSLTEDVPYSKESKESKEKDLLAEDWSQARAQETPLLAQVNQLGKKQLKELPSYRCGDISFITDFPGVAARNRLVFSYLAQELDRAKDFVMAESAYFVLREGGVNLIRKLSDKDVSTSVLTNGLYSTDAYYTLSAFFANRNSLQGLNLDVFAYDGSSPAGSLPFQKGRWGIHSKRAVIDGQISLLGTYNIDPRSANLNSEVLIICRDSPRLAKAIEESIRERQSRSHPLVDKGELATQGLFHKASLRQKMFFYLATPLAATFDFLL